MRISDWSSDVCSSDLIVARIRLDHRPYHAALSRALAAARARFGVAVLLDLHSMPPLGTAADTVRIVFGDRFGKSAGGRFVARLEGEAEAAGLRQDRKSTRLNSSHSCASRMPSS